MKKIFELIKKLLGGGSSTEKAAQLAQLETEVKKESDMKKQVKETVKVTDTVG